MGSEESKASTRNYMRCCSRPEGPGIFFQQDTCSCKKIDPRSDPLDSKVVLCIGSHMISCRNICLKGKGVGIGTCIHRLGIQTISAQDHSFVENSCTHICMFVGCIESAKSCRSRSTHLLPEASCKLGREERGSGYRQPPLRSCIRTKAQVFSIRDKCIFFQDMACPTCG